MATLLESPVDEAPVLPDIMVPVPARVVKVDKETYDTFTLTVAGENGPLPEFLPGQISMLYAFGVGETPISISGDPSNPEQHRYTIRAVGMATNHLVTRKPGEMIGVRGPFGRPWPVGDMRGRDIIVVAGGIGLAPLRPAIYHMLRHRGEYGKLNILYGARSPRDLLYKKEMSAWGYLPDTRVLQTVDYGGVSWRGHVGVVTTLFRNLRFNPVHTDVLICGPEIMMRFVCREVMMRGVAAEHIWLTMERNMKCSVGFCGHCQLGQYFVCRDGPVFNYAQMENFLERSEL
jgi:NAD(P)H-flavin reductase